MEEKFKDLIELCKNNIILTDENVGEGRVLVDRKTFQLVIPLDNTEEYGVFFVNSIKGHDCFSYNSESTHVYHIIDGMGEFIVDDNVIKANPGDTITIEPGKVFTYKGSMIIVFEMIPNFKEENDHFVKAVDY
ncbi:hypothetical protein IJH72_01045 [Candidatus Saccharibacteria bacterium]|nr:hypothetical protein [Candidatus Saccharibacteria bacterium]MBR0372517.1 hypothetical protein [Candidatus Saccharibacteria bacterium]